jgi:hypothetical protein
MSILSGDMKFYLKHYGRIAFRAMEQQKLHLITWYMVKRPYYPGRLWPVQDV